MSLTYTKEFMTEGDPDFEGMCIRDSDCSSLKFCNAGNECSVLRWFVALMVLIVIISLGIITYCIAWKLGYCRGRCCEERISLA